MDDKIATKIVNLTGRWPARFRNRIYELVGLTGKGQEIRKGCSFDHVKNVRLGSNVFVNQNVQFHIGDSNESTIEISDNVYIGMNACFVCVSHIIGKSDKRAGSNQYKSIKVEKGAWIGANVLVLSGVTIGKGCVIAAGAVVCSNCDDNWLYAGNPAIKKKRLSCEREINV